MITNKYEAKTMTEHISCDCKFKFYTTTCVSKQKWNKNVKIIISVKKIIVGILAYLLVRIVST